MCRILKVLVVAPAEQHVALRRTLASLEYDVVAILETDDGVTADVALAVDQDAATIGALKARGLRVIAVRGDVDAADLPLDDPSRFAARVWELFRAR